MKKMFNILIVLIILSSMIPLTFADDSNNISNSIEFDLKTRQETDIMNDKLGAEIRLLQLEKSIIRNINTGEEIISILEETYIDITDLQLILAELELLIQEVQSADPDASDAVRIFLDLKYDAVNLSTDFRGTLRGLIGGSLIEQIQQQTRNMTCDQILNLSQTIQNKIQQYNVNQFNYFYQIIGENGNKYILGYQNGSLTRGQVKQNIMMNINQTGKDVQFTILTALKQHKIRYLIQSQNEIQNASQGFQQRQETRLKNRLKRIESFPDNSLYQQLMNRIENKLNNMGDIDIDGNGSNHGGDNGNGQDKSGNRDNDESNNPPSGGGDS